MSGRGAALGVGAVVVALVGAFLMIPAVFVEESCDLGGSVDLAGDPSTDTGGTWKKQQLANAAAIIRTGSKLGVPARGQAIAVMTAMGESSLRVLDRGDAAGPDSRGLFQQRDSWGPRKVRMNPAGSAELFYRALLRVEGWGELAPTIAAHKVQGNADPHHYERFWPQAQQVVSQLTAEPTAEPSGDQATPSPGTDDVELLTGAACATTLGGWTDGGDCVDTLGTPRNCAAAQREAARIAQESPCDNEVRGGDWDNRCGEFSARVYGYSSSGEATAMSHYRMLKGRDMIHRDKEPPVGALLFFATSQPAGHVAVYAGGGRAWSNDYVRNGCIDLTPVDTIAAGSQYLGWSEPYFPLGGRLTPDA